MFVLWLILSASAARASDYNREKLDVLGWRDGCAVAVAHYGYPPAGQAITDDPVMTHIGILSIGPGETKEKEQWLLSLHGPWTWRPKEAGKILSDLRAKGYVKPGMVEDVGTAPVAPERDLPRLISTTDTLKAVYGKPRPDPGWKWTAIYYEPVGTCALFLYQKTVDGRVSYDYVLARVGNPAARRDRAEAHLTNALLLVERGELDSAVIETATAAHIAPDYAPGRYHHAALMATTGVIEPALDELEAAVALDAKYREKARKDKDFETLHWHPKFKELTSKRRAD